MTEMARRRGVATVGRRPLGEGDCERWRATGVGQPTNTATSTALVLAGLWVLQRARTIDTKQRWRPLGYGVLLAAAGLGSVAYHGLGGTPSERAHDRSIDVLVLATVLGEVERTVRRRSRRISEPRAPAAVALAAALVAPIAYGLGRTSATTCRPESRWQWHGLWHVLAAVAGTAWAERTLILPHAPPEPHGSGLVVTQGTR